MNSNFIQDYFKPDQSTETNKDSHLSVNNKQEVTEQAADNLLFNDLVDVQQDQSIEIEVRKRVKSDHDQDQHVHVEKSQFSNNDQLVNEYDIKSTLSSEDEKSCNLENHLQNDKFEVLDRILSEFAIGAVPH